MKVIIIDDERKSLENLEWLLHNYVPKVEIMGMYQDPYLGLEAIQQHGPDLLFIDIQMPKMNGFELLTKLDLEPCYTIFITAYNGFIRTDIEKAEIPLLLKPIDPDKLVAYTNQVQSDTLNIISKEKAELMNRIYLRRIFH